jgi:hypothetical protein
MDLPALESHTRLVMLLDERVQGLNGPDYGAGAVFEEYLVARSTEASDSSESQFIGLLPSPLWIKLRLSVSLVIS